MRSRPLTRSQATPSTRPLLRRAAKRKASMSADFAEAKESPMKKAKAEPGHAGATALSPGAGFQAQQITTLAANTTSLSKPNHDCIPNHTRKRLEDARRRVPRYLFRGFHRKSGGGQAGLNGPKGVVPHAFLDGSTKSSIYEYGRSELRKLVRAHLTGRIVRSPFSSWSACLSIAIGFAHCAPNSYVAIVDLQRLPMVATYPVEGLHTVGLSHFNSPYEVLLFGRVEGGGFSALPHGIWPTRTLISASMTMKPESVTLTELFRACVRIARPLGVDFILPFATALVTAPDALALFLKLEDNAELSLLFQEGDPMAVEPVPDYSSDEESLDSHSTDSTDSTDYAGSSDYPPTHTHTSRFESLDRSTIDDMLQILEGIEIPHEHSLDRRIIGDGACVGPALEARDWLMLLRVISQARWGRGGRQRVNGLTE